MRYFKYAIVGGYIAGITLLFYIIGLLYHQTTTAAGTNNNSVIVEIPQGASLTRISHILSEQGLILSPSAFRLLAYIKNKQKQIQLGEFDLNATMTPGEILEKITSGKALLHSITIPEGYRILEINQLLVSKGLTKGDEFISQTKNPTLLKQLNIPTDSLEGYLFPDTYHFARNTSAQAIVETMINTFKDKVLKKEFLQQAQTMGFSFHEIITLASIIEKETGAAEERKMISSVFHNRLKKHMLLQTDPTVIYAIKDFDGNLRKKDLSMDSPYNTYRYSGLPPGPIASPGLESITAALNPSETQNLYFVSKQDGHHQFSTNLSAHNMAVRKYQLR
ncbi:MAG: aminodeoxychorismate lyase [Nitrospinae bacterium CG11_big_fil_rev_8_21_14_0_20_45_15]|nr:MAG: aminodeoxychorismate lyase [Nitrospinae bacterium CG11_big_fil_rev_8_21_14_0_20_45_15]